MNETVLGEISPNFHIFSTFSMISVMKSSLKALTICKEFNAIRFQKSYFILGTRKK